MKKTVICLCVFLCLLMVSCAQTLQTNPNTESTAPSTYAPPTTTQSQPLPTPAPTTEPTTHPSDPPEPSTTEVPTTVSAELAAYNALFGNHKSWYNRVLTCQYESPKELNLLDFFYCGFGDERIPTDAEWEALKDLQGFNENYDFFRLPVDKMNEVLTTYFDITLDDLEPSGFEGLVYLEGTNCYYFMTTGANVVGNFCAISAETAETGIIALRYAAGWTTPKEYIVTLKPTDGGYIILSNVAV